MSNKNNNKLKTVFTSKTNKSSLLYHDNIVNNKLLDHIKTLNLIHRPTLTIFGKVVEQNRDVGFFSNDSIGYNYSRKLMKSQPLTDTLIKLLQDVNKLLDTNFNGILINKYNTGEDYIGAHSDSETGLAKNGMVASISLGKSRKFRIRDISTKEIIIDVDTIDCQLLVMAGEFQKEFTHEIPQQKKIVEPRWSLTFRSHVK